MGWLSLFFLCVVAVSCVRPNEEKPIFDLGFFSQLQQEATLNEQVPKFDLPVLDNSKEVHENVKTVIVTKKVPVPYTVQVERKVPYAVKVPVRRPYAIYIPKPYVVEIPKPIPYAVKVPIPQPYTVEKHVPVPYRVPVDKPYPVQIPKPFPIVVEKKFPVTVEKPVPVHVQVSVDKPSPVSLSEQQLHLNLDKPAHISLDKHQDHSIPHSFVHIDASSLQSQISPGTLSFPETFHHSTETPEQSKQFLGNSQNSAEADPQSQKLVSFLPGNNPFNENLRYYYSETLKATQEPDKSYMYTWPKQGLGDWVPKESAHSPVHSSKPVQSSSFSISNGKTLYQYSVQGSPDPISQANSQLSEAINMKLFTQQKKIPLSLPQTDAKQMIQQKRKPEKIQYDQHSESVLETPKVSYHSIQHQIQNPEHSQNYAPFIKSQPIHNFYYQKPFVNSISQNLHSKQQYQSGELPKPQALTQGNSLNNQVYKQQYQSGELPKAQALTQGNSLNNQVYKQQYQSGELPKAQALTQVNPLNNQVYQYGYPGLNALTFQNPYQNFNSNLYGFPYQSLNQNVVTVNPLPFGNQNLVHAYSYINPNYSIQPASYYVNYNPLIPNNNAFTPVYTGVIPTNLPQTVNQQETAQNIQQIYPYINTQQTLPQNYFPTQVPTPNVHFTPSNNQLSNTRQQSSATHDSNHLIQSTTIKPVEQLQESLTFGQYFYGQSPKTDSYRKDSRRERNERKKNMNSHKEYRVYEKDITTGTVKSNLETQTPYTTTFEPHRQSSTEAQMTHTTSTNNRLQMQNPLDNPSQTTSPQPEVKLHVSRNYVTGSPVRMSYSIQGGQTYYGNEQGWNVIKEEEKVEEPPPKESRPKHRSRRPQKQVDTSTPTPTRTRGTRRSNRQKANPMRSEDESVKVNNVEINQQELKSRQAANIKSHEITFRTRPEESSRSKLEEYEKLQVTHVRGKPDDIFKKQEITYTSKPDAYTRTPELNFRHKPEDSIRQPETAFRSRPDDTKNQVVQTTTQQVSITTKPEESFKTQEISRPKQEEILRYHFQEVSFRPKVSDEAMQPSPKPDGSSTPAKNLEMIQMTSQVTHDGSPDDPSATPATSFTDITRGFPKKTKRRANRRNGQSFRMIDTTPNPTSR